MGFFLMTVCVTAFFTELYQNPKNINKDIRVGSTLPISFNLENIKKIKLKNRLGEFHFEKNNWGWKLTSPRLLTAKEESLNFILSSLNEIKVNKAFRLDTVDESGLYLNSPFMEISFTGENELVQTIKFGMIDSKNNTTYVGITGKEIIYQINSFENPLEKLDLMYFIDPRVFYFSSLKVSSLKIYEGTNTPPILSIMQNSGTWLGKNGQVLNQKKVEEYFKILNGLKSDVILDQLSEDLNGKIKKSLEKPLFIVEVLDLENKRHFFQIFPLVNSIPDLKIDKKESIIVSVNDSEQKYLLSRKFLEVFQKREESF